MHAYHYLCAMSERRTVIEAGPAKLERVEDLIEIHFDPGAKVNIAGMGEVVRAKSDLCSTEALDVLAILPEELDMDLNVLAVDHHEVNGGCGLARRLALVANSSFNTELAGIYFRYHPRSHETKVFLHEADARRWLATRPVSDN